MVGLVDSRDHDCRPRSPRRCSHCRIPARRISRTGWRRHRPAHWFGTDELGRDIYTRVLYGGRITLGMVVAVVLLVAPVGLVVGSIAGYLGGFADRALMRVTDVFLAFPRLILALAFVAALKPGITSAVFAIALTSWPPYARLARADTLTIRNTDFIAAVRLTGAASGRIILRHVMPLCLSSVIVRVTLDMSGIILTAAGLGFLGMGAQPPMPEWGTMIASSRAFILEQWWVPTIPGIAIFVASLAFNLLGDGMRDVLDPKSAMMLVEIGNLRISFPPPPGCPTPCAVFR